VIRLQDRDQNGYYDALAAADAGDLNLLAQLVAQRSASTLEQYIAAQQETPELTEWAGKIAGEAATRANERRKATYLRWSRTMESLRNDFQRCAAKVTSSGIEVQFRAYPIVDEIAWDNIRSGIGASSTWFFTLSFQKDRRRFRYIFFFGKHYWTREDSLVEKSEPRVALLISEQEGDSGDAKRLGTIPNSPIRLREVFASDGTLVAVNATIADGGVEAVAYDRVSSSLGIAQQFIEQVLLRRLF